MQWAYCEDHKVLQHFNNLTNFQTDFIKKIFKEHFLLFSIFFHYVSLQWFSHFSVSCGDYTMTTETEMQKCETTQSKTGSSYTQYMLYTV